MQNEDTRFVKTELSIQKAFMNLMEKEGFSQINVTKIITEAQINRSTFYSHYMDKYDLLDHIEAEVFKGLKNIEDASAKTVIKQFFDEDFFNLHFKYLIDFLKNNGAVIGLLVSDKGDPAFTNKLNRTLKEIWSENKMADKLTIPQCYLSAALVGLMTNLIVEWVHNDFRESPEEFAEITQSLIKDIPKNILAQ